MHEQDRGTLVGVGAPLRSHHGVPCTHGRQPGSPQDSPEGQSLLWSLGKDQGRGRETGP